MTVRLKISLLITAAGFLASLAFSGFILREMVEQPFRLVDAELTATAERIAERVAAGDETPFSSQRESEQYWLEVRDRESGISLYRSPLADMAGMAWPDPGKGASIDLDIPAMRTGPGLKEVEDETFRVRTVPLSIQGKEYLVCIGRPIENLKEELEDTVAGVGGGLAFSVLLLAGISYFVAGYILRPVRRINTQAREISEKQLDRRVPTSGNHDEFDILAHTLNKVFDRLQHAFLRQKRLLADASHELKTPLTMMRLALDEIRSGTGEAGPDPQAESHGRMTAQVLRMERLVKSLLDLSSLEIEAAAARTPVDLGRILASLIADYRFIGEARRIRIDEELPERLTVSGDVEKLTRAFSNLLDNALKYNVDGGRVTVSAQRSEDGVTVVIGNSGPGVPEADIPRVFEQFYRVEKSRSLRHGGSGLGLAIAKRIIELHGGTIQLESQPNYWTTVTVSLPRNAS